MYIFNDTWYHGFIQAHSPGDSEEDTAQSQATKCLAHANLCAACVIAQAIDGLRDEIKDNKIGSFNDLAASVDELCRVLEQNGKKKDGHGDEKGNI
jgi:hypothetical protein